MLEKEELRPYFGQHCLMGDIQGLYFDYSSRSLHGPLLNSSSWCFRREIPDHILGIRPFEEYDAAIEYLKEFGKLIDTHYKTYCKDDQEKLDKLYRFYEQTLISGLFFEIRSLMLESPEAVKHFRHYFEESYDYMYDNTWGWSSWASNPCYCKKHSKVYINLEYEANKNKKIKEEATPEAHAFWAGAYDILNKLVPSIVKETEKLPEVELKILRVMDLYSSDAKLKEELQKSDVFMELFDKYLKRLRSDIEVNVDNVELGREIFNDHLREKCNLYIDTPVSFIEHISRHDLVEHLLKNCDSVPCYLAKIHNVIYAERF